MRLLPITNSCLFTKISDCDYRRLRQRKLFLDPEGYVKTALKINGRWGSVSIHRVMYFDGGMRDHKNLDKLDNRRSNLRKATKAENNRNKPLYRNNTSGFKGVSFSKKMNKWLVRVACKYVGYFDCKIEGARAYNKTAKEMFGNFAKLNEGI